MPRRQAKGPGRRFRRKGYKPRKSEATQISAYHKSRRDLKDLFPGGK